MGFSFGSPKWRLSTEDWLKVGKGAGVAAAGAALTYLTAWATGQDFGAFTPVIMAVLSVLANVVRKLATDTQ